MSELAFTLGNNATIKIPNVFLQGTLEISQTNGQPVKIAYNLKETATYSQNTQGALNGAAHFTISAEPVAANANLPAQPKYWVAPQNTANGSYDCWYGDPQSVLRDPETGLYYHWSICRNGKDFGSDWWEWTSRDLFSWKQSGIRLQRGRDDNGARNSSFMGGSTILSDGKHGVPKGHLIHCCSKQSWRDDTGRSGGDQNIGVFLSEGFGKPIYLRFIFCHNKRGSDWRDSYLFYADGNLYMAVAWADHRSNAGVDIYKIGNITKFDDLQFVQFMQAEPYRKRHADGSVNGLPIKTISGCEVPNICNLGSGKWLVTYSDQEQPHKYGYAHQSCKGWICRRENGQFIIEKSVQLDYGYDAYARRINNIDGSTGGRVVSQAMVFNWGNMKGTGWTKGVIGSSGLIGYALNNTQDGVFIETIDRIKMLPEVRSEVPPISLIGKAGMILLQTNAAQAQTNVYTVSPSSKWNGDPAPFAPGQRIVVIQNGSVFKLQNIEEGYEMVFAIKNY